MQMRKTIETEVCIRRRCNASAMHKKMHQNFASGQAESRSANQHQQQVAVGRNIYPATEGIIKREWWKKSLLSSMVKLSCFRQVLVIMIRWYVGVSNMNDNTNNNLTINICWYIVVDKHERQHHPQHQMIHSGGRTWETTSPSTSDDT